MSLLPIGEVARRAQVRPSTLRYYERIGLLPAPERVSGRRRYDEGVVQTLRVIQMAQSMGFSIAEIQSLLHDFSPSAPPAERWQAFAQRKIEEADALIRQITERRERLMQTLGCRCDSLAVCAEQVG